MVTKTQQANESGSQAGTQFAETIKESAQQIWLAGLGAFAKAQQEGGKVFDSLVKDGVAIQRKTQAAAGEKFSEATSRMASMATDLSSRATGQWGKLENIFEDRVSKALDKLDVPSAKDLDALRARIDELDRSVAKLAAKRGGSVRGTGSTRASAGRAAVKPVVKRAPVRKAS
jgi:poly(hydroxyalkanoate) granule-associated protein